MFNTSVDKKSIDSIQKLEMYVSSMENKINAANDRAAIRSVAIIEKDLRERGRPGRFIKGDIRKYGQFGLRLSFEPTNLRGGNRTGGGKRMYNAKIAADIFIFSESGVTGRKAFTLPRKTSEEWTSARYQISHSSGRWKKGQRLRGPLRIPAIGKFYFSAKAGKPRITIKKMANKVIREELNKEYNAMLKRYKK
jgi:hypothetical protein